jgi:hypothetical protein
MYKDCFLLEKREEIEHGGIDVCCKPSDQPGDAARREECSGLDEKEFNYFLSL